MSVSVAGPSQTSGPTSLQQPPSADFKRKSEGDDAARRSKHPRPPLPPPHVLSSLVPDSAAFVDLLTMEQKLDWTLLRKKAEINDSLGRPLKVKRSLRVFLSNTAHDQPWQKELDSAAEREKDAVDVSTGAGIPGWVLRIEGRLLDSGNARLDRARAKFTSFVRSAIVEFDDRSAPTFPEGNILEWQAQGSQTHLDGFEVRRRGDANLNCRVILHVSHQPERFRVLPPLADLIALREGTRSDVMTALWKLVKVVGAQDKEDATIIRSLGGLQKIFPPGQDIIAFHQLPELATRFLAHPDPVVLPFTIRVDRDFNLHSKCFDIPIEIDDPSKSKLSTIISSFEGEEGKEVVRLEDKVAELAYFARDLKQKRDFLESFAAQPSVFIQNWLAAQARDLDQMLGYQIGAVGTNGGSVREEDLRRSDIFDLPWVNEAITVHEAARLEAERRTR